MPDPLREPTARAEFAQFLRAARGELLEAWEAELAPPGREQGLPPPALLDRFPEILEALAASLEERGPFPTPEILLHARERFAEGFEPSQAVAEYGRLRDVILRAWSRRQPLRPLDAVRALCARIDRAVSETVELQAAERGRALLALERISTSALESRTLGELLDSLLARVFEACPAVDAAGFLLLEGDRLRVAAVRGLDAGCAAGLELRVGEGFAGRVAAERRPLELGGASGPARHAGVHECERGLRALYGVPLISAGELVGVAQAGSLGRAELGATDRQLLRAMAERAAAGIRLHALRERSERDATELLDRAIQQEALAELGARALASDDVEGLLSAAVERVASVLGSDLAMVGELAGDRLRMRAGWGWDEGTVGRAELPVYPGSLAGLALHQHAPAVVEDVAAWKGFRFAPVVEEHGARSGASVPLEHGRQRGVLSVFSRAPRRFRAFDVQFLRAVSSLVAVALDRADALAAIRASEEAARRGEEQLRFLSDAGTVLSGSLDFRRTAQQLTDLAVPRIADWCMLDLIDAEGTVTIAALSSADPERLRIDRVREYRATHPLRAEAPYGLATVLTTGESLLIREVSARRLLELAPDEQYARWILEARIRSLLAVPLRGTKRAVGVLSFATTRRSGRLLGDEERAVAEALAARAALALENAALYEEAQRAIRLREDMLAVVSHDLKTPLQSILLSARLLADRSADPDARRRAGNIERAADRATAQLRDLLDMASIQAGRLAVHLARAEAVEIAMEALELQLPAAQERGVTLVREGSGGPVLADRERIVQVLGNLLGNALKFSPAGKAVVLRLAEAPEGVHLSVSDAGPGIAPEDLPRIFEAYWSARRDPGGPPSERGAGLGLFIAKGILDAHGARLAVQSLPGAGCTFGFTLRRPEPAGGEERAR